MTRASNIFPTSTHWGNYLVEVDEEQLIAVHPAVDDPDPTAIGQSLLNSQDSDCRIPQPMIRKDYLEKREKSDGTQRGKESFVAVSWERALDIAAEAIEQTRSRHENGAIYGGSYGWASAGRFHHANSQIHRFLNCCGGYTSSRDSYSAAAAEVIMPHVLGMNFYDLMMQSPTIADIKSHTRTVVCFGGIAMKNTQVMAGGLGAHTASQQLQSLLDMDIDFINISPIKDDMAEYMNAEWWPCRPNSDVAIMLAMAHTIVTEDLYDKEFIDKYCEGLDQFLPYLLGNEDGVAKEPEWAANMSEIPAEKIRACARRMAEDRCLIGISWSLQRSEFGEQSYWMATLLSALLGYIGLPGGGVAYGYGSVHSIGFAGRRLPNFKMASVPQGKNPIKTFIPVARIADMLLAPGERFQYNGLNLKYPDIRLVY
jgi:biotin/methionine sulfoxide reductase